MKRVLWSIAVVVVAVSVMAATKTTSKTGTSGVQDSREFQQELRVKFNAAVDDIDTLMAKTTGGVVSSLAATQLVVSDSAYIDTLTSAVLSASGTVAISGKLNLAIKTATGDTTVPANSSPLWLCSKTGGTMAAVTLPAATGNAGDVYILRGTVAGDTVIIKAGSTTIDSLIGIESFRVVITGANAGFMW